MKKIVLSLFAALLLSACGQGGGSSGTAMKVVGPTGPAYTFKVFGGSNTFACIFWANFGDADQTETQTGVQSVSAGGSSDWDIDEGRNVVGQCAQHTGAGIITIQIFKAGVLVDTKVSGGNGTSASFNIDI